MLAVAAVTRLVYASNKSLVLDEFHSYYHATARGWDGLMARLLADNHPPLSFVVIGLSGSVLGLAEWALRLPAVVLGLLEIAAVASLAKGLSRRRNRASLAAIAAAALLSASSLHFDYGTQARMYAFLALFITLATAALIAMMNRGQSPERSMVPPAIGFALAAAAAFHTHYFAVQYLTALGFAFTVLAWIAKERRALRAFFGAAAGTAVLSAPWALTGFRQQLAHALPPGGDDVSISALAQAFVQLFFHNIRFGGSIGRLAFIAGAALVLLVALRGVYVGLQARDLRGRLNSVGLLAVSAFVVPVLSWTLALALPRAGFTWHYVLPSAAPVAILFAVGATDTEHRGQRIALVAATLAWCLAAVLTGLHLLRPATEDFRGAVSFALQERAAAPSGEVTRIVSVEWQPALFPQGQPYDYYAPRLSSAAPPEREPMLEGEFTVASLERLKTADRVIVVRRSLPDGQHLLRHLADWFPKKTVTEFGFGLDVRVFTR